MKKTTPNVSVGIELARSYISYVYIQYVDIYKRKAILPNRVLMHSD